MPISQNPFLPLDLRVSVNELLQSSPLQKLERDGSKRVGVLAGWRGWEVQHLSLPPSSVSSLRFLSFQEMHALEIRWPPIFVQPHIKCLAGGACVAIVTGGGLISN